MSSRIEERLNAKEIFDHLKIPYSDQAYQYGDRKFPVIVFYGDRDTSGNRDCRCGVFLAREGKTIKWGVGYGNDSVDSVVEPDGKLFLNLSDAIKHCYDNYSHKTTFLHLEAAYTMTNKK